jgi:hypothetical protein
VEDRFGVVNVGKLVELLVDLIVDLVDVVLHLGVVGGTELGVWRRDKTRGVL